MKHTKANVIKLLQVMSDSNWRLAQAYQAENDEARVKHYVHDMCTIESIINIIIDKDEFDTVCKIYDVKE